MSKNIVICSDGTWNRPEKDLDKDVPTNVLKLARAIRPRYGTQPPQQVFYDWGVGSYYDPVIGGGTGKGLHKNIMDAYRYIVQNYAPGDRLFLFGFSRGAYTVRCLSGLINNCGILKRPDARLIQTAFTHYKRSSAPYAPQGAKSVAFRQKYSHASREVHFIGVWDTVGAMGIPISFLGLLDDKDEFYDTKIGGNVRIARQALAIDELRKDFEPTIWEPKDNLDLKQVWFAGAHSDVGGGYQPDKDGASLSDYPLSWMIRESGLADLAFEPHLKAATGPDKPKATLHQSRRKYYRLKKKFFRPIKHENGDVIIHESVKRRWQLDQGYRPENLETYVNKVGWDAVNIEA